MKDAAAYSGRNQSFFRGNGLAGKSVSDLMDKMKAYQSGTFTDAKLLGMQQVLKPLSDKQLLDLAAYINKM